MGTSPLLPEKEHSIVLQQ